MTSSQHLDAIGRLLQPGQVAVHFHVASRHMDSHLVVIRELKENGNLIVDKVDGRMIGIYPTWKQRKIFTRTTIKVPKYLVLIPDMTEDQVRKKYDIYDETKEEEGHASTH